MLNLRKNIEQFINNYIDKMKQNVPENTGALKNSLESNISIDDNGINIGIDALDYAKFQDLGVNGTETSYGSPYSFKRKPSPFALENFAKSIGASPFALSNSIFKKGIRPKLFATDTIDKELPNLGDAVINGMWEDFYETNKETKQ